MFSIDNKNLILINQLCNSHGDFNDQLIENSFFLNMMIDNAWFYKLSQVSIKYDSDLVLQNEKRIICCEQKLKEHFGNLNLYEMQDFNMFIDILYSQIKEEHFFFLKEEKIQEILGVLQCGRHKCMNSFSTFEKICISRLVFNEVEHEKIYKEYSKIKKDEFEWQPIKIFVLDNKEEMCSYLLREKCTVWDEKIGGTIFACPFDNKNKIMLPYLRTIFRFYHYYFELKYTSRYYEHLTDNNFGARISSYIEGKFSDIDFFEPHALLESMAWQKSIDYIMNKYAYLFGGIWENVLVKKSGQEIFVYPNCVVDYISNIIHARNEKRWRVTSMIIKKNIFELIVGREHADSILIKSMDSGSMKSGYEYNMYNK